MLARAIDLARDAPAVHFHITRLIFAFGHILKRQIFNAHQLRFQLAINLFGFGVHFGHFDLFCGHQGPQPFKFSLITAGFGGANGFAGFVLFGLRGFSGQYGRAAAAVDIQKRRGHRRYPTPRQSGVKSGWIIANGPDVMHLEISYFLPSLFSGALMHHFALYG